MKKWLAIFTCIVVLILTGFLYFKKTEPKTSPHENNVLSVQDAPTTTPPWKQSTIVNADNILFRISWAIVQPEEVELYSNLKAQQLSEQIKVDKNCQVLVNGGFYSKENTHLGLFITNFETISPKIDSGLLNGFLSIKSKNVVIDNYFPDDNPRIAVQSGPLLIQKGNPLSLIISNDEPNRRIAAGVTSDNKLIFIVVYRDGSIYQGPLLGSLPEILTAFKKQTGIDIVNAINLDGGSASIFISNYDRLDELAHIGSYFCIK